MLVLSILFGAALPLAAAYAWGVLVLRRLPAPPEIALALGAAVESLLVFLLLVLHLGWWPAYLAVGLAPLAALPFLHRTGIEEPALEPLGRYGRIAAVVIFAAYGVWYLVNAMAPEISPDGITYHLGLPFDYARLGRFPHRFTFYDALPQGVEMLFTMAFAFGRHSAAKLVEFGFLAATPTLFLRIGRRLRLPDLASLLAAVFYFCAPVTGITGATSYNEAALVFFTMAAFYLLLVWRDTGQARYLPAAGLAAGFCYAIKLPGAMALVGGAILVAVWGSTWRWRGMALLVAGALPAMAPWLARNAVVARNPLAPLANAVFPNSHFHVFTERILAASLAGWGHTAPLDVPWQLAFGDHFTGTFGPLLLALPLALLAWRSRAARLVLAAAALLALPWLANKGARFLMPSMALAGLALGGALAGVWRGRAAWAAVALQAIVCWPQALNLWQPDYVFRLHDFPLAAALRIEPEAVYLARTIPEYRVARMVESNTPADARIFSFDAVANAYLPRSVIVSWQSAEGDRMADALRAARYPEAMYQRGGHWQSEPLMGFRFRLLAAREGEWDVEEVEIRSQGKRVPAAADWTLRARPNIWEAPLAVDDNYATRWRTWRPIKAGMTLEVDFEIPVIADSVALVSHAPGDIVPLEIWAKQLSGAWRLVANSPPAVPSPAVPLRLEATAALRRAGFRYLLAPVEGGGNSPIGMDMLTNPLAWDLDTVARAGWSVLFRIRRPRPGAERP
ncbi:MAG: ArnT family glycosyltransferase [Bryobacteraceae bacterium]